MTRSSTTVNCNFDWLKSPDPTVDSPPFLRQRTVEHGGVPEVLSPYRKGVDSLKCFYFVSLSAFADEYFMNVSVYRMPCRLCGGGNFTGAFRPLCRSVLAASMLTLAGATTLNTAVFRWLFCVISTMTKHS